MCGSNPFSQVFKAHFFYYAISLFAQTIWRLSNAPVNIKINLCCMRFEWLNFNRRNCFDWRQFFLIFFLHLQATKCLGRCAETGWQVQKLKNHCVMLSRVQSQLLCNATLIVAHQSKINTHLINFDYSHIYLHLS